MVLIAALFISAPGHAIAQDLQQSIPSNTALAGAVINSESTGNYQASLAFRKALSGPLATITFYDVSGVNVKQHDFTNMQYSARQALTARITQIKPWLGVWALGEFGVTGTQGVSTGSAFGAGGYADIAFGKNHSVHAWIMPKVTKNTVQGSNFEMRFYVGPSW
jgi:hypothetical protein